MKYISRLDLNSISLILCILFNFLSQINRGLALSPLTLNLDKENLVVQRLVNNNSGGCIKGRKQNSIIKLINS